LRILTIITRRTLLLLLCSLCHAQEVKPHVLLVSIDGFRHDYADKFGAKHLLELREKGASAEALIPVFPSTTFPNHYSIVTGLYPARHGLVDNRFWDPARKEYFFFKDPKNAGDGSWFNGTPLWSLAEKAGIRTATMHWVGSEAEIARARPTSWSRFDGSLTPDQRVDRVLGWLRLPEPQRPRFIALYFDDVDKSGHRYGPDAPQTRAAVLSVDAAIGRLLRDTPIPLNVVVTSDHGMMTLAGEPIYIGDITDLKGFEVAANGSNVMLYSSDAALVDRTYKALKASGAPIDVYRRAEIPEHWHYSGSNRIGDLLLVSRVARIISNRRPPPDAGSHPLPAATHSFDPARFPDMLGIFYASGPNIRRGARLKSFENVHIYPLLARILGLTPPSDIDSRSAVLEFLYVR
jgi:alkaline phosphatase D